MTAITGIHPYARHYRMRSDDELLALGADIKDNGQRVPIILTPDGLVLDGRQRARACELVGVVPVAEVTDVPESEWSLLVLSLNSHRRHDTQGQNAMSAALVLFDDGRRENGRWKRGTKRDIGRSSDIDDGWEKALNRAGLVLDHAAQLAGSVVNGELSLNAAHDKAVESRDAKRNELAEEERLAVEEADARVFVEANDAELAAQVGDGPDHPLRTYVEAMDVWKRRNAEAAKVIADKQAADKKAEEDEARIQRDKYTRLAKALQVISLMGEDVDLPHLMDKYDVGHLSPPSLKREFTAKKLGHARDLVEHIINWEETKS